MKTYPFDLDALNRVIRDYKPRGEKATDDPKLIHKYIVNRVRFILLQAAVNGLIPPVEIVKKKSSVDITGPHATHYVCVKIGAKEFGDGVSSPARNDFVDVVSGLLTKLLYEKIIAHLAGGEPIQEELPIEELKVDKPPIGLTPRLLWLEERTQRILQVMQEYNDKGLDIQDAWIDELKDNLNLRRTLDKRGKQNAIRE